MVDERIGKVEKNVQEGFLLNLGRSDDPAKIQQGLNMLEDKSSDMIDPKAKAVMKAQFEDRLERVQNRLDGQAVLHTANGLLHQYKDPELALANFDADMSLQEHMGLRNAEGVRTWLRDHITDQKTVMEKQSGEKVKDIMETVNGRQLSKARQMLTENRDNMTKTDFDICSNALRSEASAMRSEGSAARAESREKVTAERNEKAAKSEQMRNDLGLQIIRGGITKASDIYAQIPNGLSTKDAHALASEIGTLRKDEQLRVTDKMITDYAWKQYPKPEDVEKREQFIGRLHGDVRSAQKQGEDPAQYTDKIIEKSKKDSVHNALDKVGSGLGGNVKTTILPDGKKYKDGDIYIDPKGKKFRVTVN